MSRYVSSDAHEYAEIDDYLSPLSRFWRSSASRLPGQRSRSSLELGYSGLELRASGGGERGRGNGRGTGWGAAQEQWLMEPLDQGPPLERAPAPPPPQLHKSLSVPFGGHSTSATNDPWCPQGPNRQANRENNAGQNKLESARDSLDHLLYSESRVRRVNHHTLGPCVPRIQAPTDRGSRDSQGYMVPKVVQETQDSRSQTLKLPRSPRSCRDIRPPPVYDTTPADWIIDIPGNPANESGKQGGATSEPFLTNPFQQNSRHLSIGARSDYRSDSESNPIRFDSSRLGSSQSEPYLLGERPLPSRGPDYSEVIVERNRFCGCDPAPLPDQSGGSGHVTEGGAAPLGDVPTPPTSNTFALQPWELQL